MLTYSAALKRVLNFARKKTSIVKVEKSLQHVCVRNINSKKNNPFFNNSLLDGFAFKSSDTVSNKSFKILGATSAGQKNKIKYKKNCCYRISTGAKMFHPYDCMMPYENLQIEKGVVKLKKKISKDTNVRKIGSDYKKGQIILKKNTTITAPNLLALKSLGIKNIKVYQKPTIILFCTGNEIIDNVKINDKIINSIPEYIKSFSEKLNFKFIYLGILKDNVKQLHSKIRKIQSIKNVIIVSTGGVSAGHKDFIPQVLKKNKFKVIFHKILMKPGRPTLFAIKKSSYYFGLPGNPISTIVGFHFLITPLLLRLQSKILKLKNGRMLQNYKKNKKLTLFLRGKTNNKTLKILSGQESFRIKSLVNANCWIKLNQKKSIIKKGSRVDYYDY